MDYEKKYQEALERAKNFIENGDERERTIAESIFAGIIEESEDERIRKYLIKCVNENMFVKPFDDDGFGKHKVLAWFEKQSEHAKFRDSIQVGDKVTRNQDGVLVNLSQLERVAKPAEEYNITGIGSKNAQGKLGEMIKNLKPVNEVLEQKPWSEEDEEMIDSIIGNIKYLYSIGSCDNATVDMKVNWLKSLSSQSQWKPSDEMLEALYRVIPENVMEISEDEMLLDKLYQGLKYGRVLSEN